MVNFLVQQLDERLKARKSSSCQASWWQFKLEADGRDAAQLPSQDPPNNARECTAGFRDTVSTDRTAELLASPDYAFCVANVS